jgi:hypothetical protein
VKASIEVSASVTAINRLRTPSYRARSGDTAYIVRKKVDVVAVFCGTIDDTVAVAPPGALIVFGGKVVV